MAKFKIGDRVKWQGLFRSFTGTVTKVRENSRDGVVFYDMKADENIVKSDIRFILEPHLKKVD